MSARALLSVAISMAAFFAAGAGIVDLVPSLRRRPAALRIALAYLLGIAWVCGGAYAASHFLHLTVGRKLWTALALLPLLPLLPLLASAALRVRRRDVPRFERPAFSRDPFVLALCLLVPLVTGALLFDALSNPIGDWDGRMTWGAQGRWLAAERTVDMTVLRDPRYWLAHPHYPLLMPLAQVVPLQALGSGDERVVRPLYALFWPVLVLLVFGFLRPRAGRRAAAITALLVGLAPFPAFFSHGGAAGAMSDMPLACFWGAGLALLLDARRASAAATAGLLLAAAVLTKNEGLPLALVALGAAALHALLAPRLSRRGRLLACGTAAGAVLLAAALLLSWRARIPNRWDEKYPSFPDARVVARTAERLPEVLPSAARETFGWKAWRGFWVATPILVLLGSGALRFRAARALALSLAGAAAFYAIAYGASPWPARAIVEVTWNRFLTQLLVPWALLVGLALRAPLRDPPRS